MEVDNEIEGQLLQQFSCMGTEDREVLIKEFQNLSGAHLDRESCAFYLDMNHWNLQAAIGSYYDYEQQPQATKVPCMVLVQDVTIGEGESVTPNTQFVKTWRVKNNGTEIWPPGCCLRFLQGEQFGDRDRIMVDALLPYAHMDISVAMKSPGATGVYQGQWRMQTPTGLFFGDIIWVILHVEESGLLGVTQQLSTIGSEFAHRIPSEPANPFGSPPKPPFLEYGTTYPGPRPTSPIACGLFSSPTPSMVTQTDSLPSSPTGSSSTHYTSSSAPNGAAVSIALFQSTCNSNVTNNEIEVLQSPSSPGMDMDSNDML